MDPVNPLTAGWIAGGAAVALAAAALYLAPTWIAIARDVPQKFPIFLLNLLFGCSIVCSAIALAFALGPTKGQIGAMQQSEQLAIDADLAIVEMERRSRKAFERQSP